MSETDTLAAAIQRSTLGVGLSVFAFLGFGVLLGGLGSARPIVATGGLIVFALPAVWIALLFVEGLRER
ncbi:hypothetical protein [Halococcoides cellulosivorans]|uniref:Uncharacterized protein n=1 Tax=Halococcoides cellulosivorans TaxID=1679096 RepID=A0A2R4WZ84_9EURY|nr:hypothetical protein [Halococcoides cellulosivorans]AWB26851.1 hypothetical protein HARCEL1_03530 [Halococcoides cellulosivorans]